VPSDIEIAQSTRMAPIEDIAQAIGISPGALIHYGPYKAKVDPAALPAPAKPGKLVLVSAMSPTPAGEGKTTTLVGLADGLSRLGKTVMAALREPSLGPVFGIKGGAAGGGYAQVVPMEDINLHFTGDLHAITAANNLLAALIDNHIYQGNQLGITTVTWRRCLDMNDRQLRIIVDGVGGRPNGVERPDGFDITAASEVMAAFCLATGLNDLKARLGRMVVGRGGQGQPITAGDLQAEGAMAVLLRDALRPNLVQTLEKTPALVHGGPFGNIAHGCNSVIATEMALGLAEFVVTEAGFGADLGAEKFSDIVCRQRGWQPAVVVIVATVRSLKHHGGGDLRTGLPNLLRHIDNVTNVFGLPAVVAINRFPDDTPDELALVQSRCADIGVEAVVADHHARGGAGAESLAQAVVRLTDAPNRFGFAYDLGQPIADKIEAVATRVYRAGGVRFTDEARADLAWLEEHGFGGLPVCMAKTQYSFSDDPKLLGAPEGFDLTVRALRVSAGAGFVVALTGTIMTMPGLPKEPSATRIDLDDAGVISGLF